LPKEDISKLIKKIAKSEDLSIDDKSVEALYHISEGDCRRVENILQSAAAISKKVNEEIIYSLASVARPKEVKDVLELALKNKFIDAREKLLDVMLNYGLSGLDVIKQVQKELYNLDIDGRSKMLLIEKCGEAEFRLTEGSDEFVQLEAFLASVTLAGKH
jgi:replication factor C small subunit